MTTIPLIQVIVFPSCYTMRLLMLITVIVGTLGEVGAHCNCQSRFLICAFYSIRMRFGAGTAIYFSVVVWCT
jgi:hypothetical protein